MDGGSSLAQAAQMRDFSLQMQGMTQSKKSTNTFKSTITRTDVSLQSHTRDEISIWHGRQREEANICGLEMEIKSLLLFYFGTPPTPHPPASFSWLLAFYSPISGWEYMTGWMVRFPAKPQHRKRDLSCPGLPTLLCPFQTDSCACTCASRRISTCKPGLSSSVELSANYNITNVGRHRTSTQPRMKWLQALFFLLFFRDTVNLKQKLGFQTMPAFTSQVFVSSFGAE